MNKTIFDFTIASIDGGKINFADYRGKKILIVNTASECGFTYQYPQLQELFEHYSEELMVIGLPSNDFG
ncbi:MAG: redoxin domain-containing protein, partial [Chitinophagales bacterium]|nr:redoxin domain-containing protein [Chitinophagales bacterium]